MTRNAGFTAPPVAAAVGTPLAPSPAPHLPGSSTLIHHFTIDVEEYFQVSAFEAHVPRERWDRLESRVARNVQDLLELLADHGARATFFVLGWVAERHPGMIRDVVSGGHEIASHGWDHARITQLRPEQFRQEARKTKRVLEDVAGHPVVGFRAPSFSLVPGCEWALEILVEEGYRYDSSLFPVRRPGYGYPNGKRDPHWVELRSGRLAEVPPATLRRWGLNMPAAGGAYFRLLPYQLVRAAFLDCERRGVPGTFYIHPWELDPEQPRLEAPPLTRLRHYGGLRLTRPRLVRLLREFRFGRIIDTVAAL